MKNIRIFSIISLILIGIAIGGTFLSKYVASQEPLKTYNLVITESADDSKPTAEDPQGHVHADGTWHADDAHSEVPEPITDATRATITDQILNLPPETLFDVLVKSYVEEHFKEYPDCQDRGAVLEDAKRDSESYLADLEYRKKDKVLQVEWHQLDFERTELHQKAVEILNIPYDLSKSERLKIAAELQAWQKKSDAHWKRRERLNNEKPVYPPQMHTH